MVQVGTESHQGKRNGLASNCKLLENSKVQDVKYKSQLHIHLHYHYIT